MKLTNMRFYRSLRHAWRGLLLAAKNERNFRVQLACALVILSAMVLVPLQSWQRVALLFVLMIVLVLELINSSLERLLDLLKPRLNEYAGDVKDMMAGAVLLASLCAVLVGLFIFWPYLLSMLVHV